MNRHAAPQTGGLRPAAFRQESGTMKMHAPRRVGIKTRLLGGCVLARLRHGDRGQALVELALSLPVLLLLLTGIMTFGIALNNYVQLVDAVSVGGRYLAIDRLNTTDPCNDAATAVKNAAPGLVRQGTLTFTTTMFNTLAAGGGQLGSYSGASCSSSSNTTGAAGNLVQNGSAQLTVTFPCNLSVYGYAWPSCTLSASITELVQ
jgi:Flp pilus assembly protein TadG